VRRGGGGGPEGGQKARRGKAGGADLSPSLGNKTIVTKPFIRLSPGLSEPPPQPISLILVDLYLPGEGSVLHLEQDGVSQLPPQDKKRQREKGEIQWKSHDKTGQWRGYLLVV